MLVKLLGHVPYTDTYQSMQDFTALRAAETGHLVLATLHTNDAASAVTRLIDMGVEPFLLSSSLLGVLAQRLVRKLCPHCRQEEILDGKPVYRPVGCDKCSQTGYLGRTGIYELLFVDDKVQHLIHNGANELEIRRAAIRGGTISMRSDGQRWVEAGITSPEEVIRATRD